LQTKDMREIRRRNRRRWRGRGFCDRGRQSCEDRRGSRRRGWWEQGRWKACWWLSSWTERKTMGPTESPFLCSRGSCSLLLHLQITPQWEWQRGRAMPQTAMLCNVIPKVPLFFSSLPHPNK